MVLSRGFRVYVRLSAGAVVLAVNALCVTGALAQWVPDPLHPANIGAPAISGSASAHCSSGCSLSVTAGGTGIGGTSDQFTFVHTMFSGDGVFVARVDGLDSASGSAKTGLMVRETLAADAKNAFALVTADGTVAFQRRVTTNQPTTVTGGGAGSAPVWLKLERVGSVFTVSRSADAQSWMTIAQDTIDMAPTVFAGVALTSGNAALKATARFSGLTARGALPAGWEALDIGGGTGGVTSYAGGQFFLRTTGRDVGGANDQFRYTYRRISGDADVVARVASVNGPNVSASGGVMIRSGLTTSASHASVLVTAGKGVAFVRRPVSGADSVSANGGPGKSPLWVKLEKRADRVAAFWSSDSVQWTFIGEQVIELPGEFYVGLTAASHDGSLASAVFDGVSVSPMAAQNQAPSVSLLSPASGSGGAIGVPISITASASDPDGQVVAIDFLINGGLVSSDAQAPFAALWTPSAPGNYSIAAVARDDRGATTRSATTVVSVLAGAPRLLSFTASTDHATLVDFYQLEIFSGASVSGSAVVVSNLGKPAPVGTEISVDVSNVLAGLPAGRYVAIVDAIGAGGVSRSTPSGVFTK